MLQCRHKTLHSGVRGLHSLLLGAAQLVLGGVELLHPLAALVPAVLQLLLQGAHRGVDPQPLCLDARLGLMGGCG